MDDEDTKTDVLGYMLDGIAIEIEDLSLEESEEFLDLAEIAIRTDRGAINLLKFILQTDNLDKWARNFITEYMEDE